MVNEGMITGIIAVSIIPILILLKVIDIYLQASKKRNAPEPEPIVLPPDNNISHSPPAQANEVELPPQYEEGNQRHRQARENVEEEDGQNDWRVIEELPEYSAEPRLELGEESMDGVGPQAPLPAYIRDWNPWRNRDADG